MFLLVIMLSVVAGLRVLSRSHLRLHHLTGHLLTRCSHSYGGGLPQMQSPYQSGLPMNAANGHGLPGSSDGPNGSNGDGHDNAFSQQLP